MTDVISIWVNCPAEDSAARIAAEALRRRLAASCNICPPITSSYRWRGRVETRPEVPLVLRSRAGLFDEVVRLIEEIHPYETPGVIGVPAGQVNASYEAWVHRETRTE